MLTSSTHRSCTVIQIVAITLFALVTIAFFIAPNFVSSPPGKLSVKHTLAGDINLVFNSVCFSPDGRFVAAGGYHHTLIVWDIAPNRIVHAMSTPSAVVYSTAFSPDGKLLAAAGHHVSADFGYGGILRLVNVDTGAQLAKLKVPFSVISAAFSPDARFVGLGGWGVPGLALFDTELNDFGDIPEFESFGMINSVTFSPDGRFMMTCDESGRIGKWDASAFDKNLSTVTLRESHNGGILDLTFSPRGTRFVSCGKDGTVKVWDTDSGRLLHSMSSHDYAVFAATFSSDGQRILSVSYKKVCVWDTLSGELIMNTHLPGHSLLSPSFAPDASLLAIGSARNNYVKIVAIDASAL